MKKLILLSIMMLAMGISLSAQKTDRDDADSKKKVEASKVAFITTYLDLSSDEAAKFWPVYNEYKNKSSDLRSKMNNKRKAAELTDDESTTKLDAMLEADSKKVTLKKTYYTKFRDILSDKKILMLMEAEREFRKQMVRHYA
ncbi:MAG: hypothetical protein KJP00_15220, partial [Bacteroidia bacterium]|nr:hypothetical protein [Bacteroidia bacterium]